MKIGTFIKAIIVAVSAFGSIASLQAENNTGMVDYFASSEEMSQLIAGDATEPEPMYEEAVEQNEEWNNTIDVMSKSCGKGCECDQCCPTRRWLVGVEAVFLVPNLGGSSTSVNVVDLAVASSAGNNGLNDLTFSPRIWLGRQGERWGVRARYWELDASQAELVPFPGQNPIPGVLASSFTSSHLEAYTIDFEVTRKMCAGRWNLLGSAGARYASFEHASISTGEVLIPQVFIGHALGAVATQFDGIGITASLEGRTKIWECRNLFAFWNARGSVIWGDVNSSAQVQSASIQNFAGAFSGVGGFTSNPETLFIGEIQLGVEWQRQLQCLPAIFFLRAAGEYQYWNADSISLVGTSRSESNPGPAVATSAASTGGVNMDLYGFSIAAGLTW